MRSGPCLRTLNQPQKLSPGAQPPGLFSLVVSRVQRRSASREFDPHLNRAESLDHEPVPSLPGATALRRQ
jgi:hypothetical protein